MKKLLFLPLFLFGQNFDDIVQKINNSLTYKIEQKKINIYEKKLIEANSKSKGSLDLEYDFVGFFKQPYSVIDINNPPIVIKTNAPMSNKTHYFSTLTYSYPIFTGYGITNLIKKSKIELFQQKLKLQNIKRNLILTIAKLYSDIYALNYQIKAMKLAKSSLLTAKEKAYGFYKAGLMDKSNYDEIDAKYYEVLADIENLNSQKIALLNQLNYLLNSDIKSIGILPKIVVKKPNFENRADVKIIKQNIKISDVEIKLTKSKNYPQIGLEVVLKREGDNFVLTKNRYQNIDQSYVGISLKYNLFNAGETKSQIAQAKLSKQMATLFYIDYLNKIKTQYNTDLNNLKSLKFSLKSAKQEINARESYFNYIQAKFNEGLADSSDLNNAIAKLALARAKKYAIKSKIFFVKEKLEIGGGYE